MRSDVTRPKEEVEVFCALHVIVALWSARKSKTFCEVWRRPNGMFHGSNRGTMRQSLDFTGKNWRFTTLQAWFQKVLKGLEFRCSTSDGKPVKYCSMSNIKCGSGRLTGK